MQQEYLDVIDEHDIVQQTLSYDQVHITKKRHRIIHLMIQNSKGQILLQKRSSQKTSYPLHWSMSVGGHVQTGETYDQAAVREAEEELGFVPTRMKELTKEAYIDAHGHSIIFTAFITTYDGAFTINKEEVEEIKFFSKEEIKHFMQTKKDMHPELLFLLDRMGM